MRNTRGVKKLHCSFSCRSNNLKGRGPEKERETPGDMKKSFRSEKELKGHGLRSSVIS